MTPRVPNEPLREAFKASGKRPGEVCRAMGMLRPNGRAATTDLQRMLGILKNSGKGKTLYQQSMPADVAQALRVALGLEELRVCVGCGEEIVQGLLCGWCVELEDAA